MDTKKKVSTWGSSRYGGGQATLLTVSILGGILLAQPLAWGIFALKTDQVAWWWAPALSLVIAPALAAIIWVLLVDRSTLKGATRNPEANIENHWYAKATESTFHALIAIMGLGAAAFSLFEWDVPASLVLAATTGLAMLMFLVSYQVHKRRGA